MWEADNNHPQVKRIAAATILELAKHFAQHPALEGWQIDNEPTIGESVSKDKIYDYGVHSAKLFTDYLKVKYNNDLDKLNTLWYNNFWSRTYNDWSEIEPPKSPIGPSLWIEWMNFRR